MHFGRREPKTGMHLLLSKCHPLRRAQQWEVSKRILRVYLLCQQKSADLDCVEAFD